MKFVFLTPLLLSCSLASADVNAVRRKVAHINAMRLSVQTQDRADFSSEGARISIWRDSKGTPHKIAVRIFGEGGQEQSTLYLQAGRPLFVFSVKKIYDRPLPAMTKVTTRTETRMYFEKGNLFQMRQGKSLLPLDVATKQYVTEITRQSVQQYLSPAEVIYQPKSSAH